MGLAASQARLLSLTSRIHDVEFEAQQIQQQKLKLALLEDAAYEEYNNALDAQSLSFRTTDGQTIAATFENLCGIGSINNKINTSAHYVFRTKDDELIVPSDVYEGFDKFSQAGSTDPYKFALYMMGVDTTSTDFSKAVSGLEANENNTALQKVKSELSDLIKNTLYPVSAKAEENKNLKDDDLTESVNKFVEEIMEALEGVNPVSTIKAKMQNREADLPEGFEAIQKKFQEYEFNLYKKNNGAKSIYENYSTDKSNFDQNKFDYYVRWAQLINLEGGLDAGGCVVDYDLEKNAQMLNDSLMSGHIFVDKIYDNRDGSITEDPTSASSDSNISYVNTSSIDSTALKRAEAKYNKKLKDIEKIDKKYDMNLNRLETERTALTTEYDSVKNVIKENIERTFGIFS